MNRYILSPQELKDLQGILLEMLIEIDKICKKHSIRYCVIGGTALGAVRHGGFIPWDDDVDICMFREEYMRFREICKTELDSNKYFFQDNTTDKYYPWGYGRLRRKNSQFVRIGQEHLKMKTGIFLDIFPLDSVPDFMPLRLLHSAYCFFLRKILYSAVGKVSEKSKVKRVIYTLLHIIPSKWVFRQLSKLHKMRQNTKYVRTLTFPTPPGHMQGFKREWYSHLKDISFEGISVPIAVDADQYLKWKYGDYMTLPPPEQRRWHPVSKFKLPE